MERTAARSTALANEKCYEFLRSVSVGRLVATQNALPLVVPVPFAVDGAAVVIRTAAEPALVRATRDAVVALQADSLDPERGAGWTVLVTGLAVALTAPEDLLRASALRLGTWFPGPCDHFVRITPGLVTGRLLGCP
jgi:uncharacterized protein